MTRLGATGRRERPVFGHSVRGWIHPIRWKWHVTDILDQLDTKRLLFSALIRELEGFVKIVGLPQDYGPAVSLEPETMARLAEYGLRLDVIVGADVAFASHPSRKKRD